MHCLWKRLIIKSCLVMLTATSLTACNTLPTVKPWEKGKLAKQEMKFDQDALESKFAEHTYFSKEAAFGGTMVGGGGCGCN